MNKKALIRDVSRAYEEIGRLRLENRRLLDETKALAEQARGLLDKLAEAYADNAKIRVALAEMERTAAYSQTATANLACGSSEERDK